MELLANHSWDLNYSNGDILNNLCFRYEYDERGRLIMKQTPGVSAVYYVYDAKDRLSMTQDGKLRADNKWLVSIYDGQDRPIKTGLWNNLQNLSVHKGLASESSVYPFSSEPSSAWELLSETHYDDYNSLPSGLTPSLINTYINGTNFIDNYNASPDYAQEVKQSLNTRNSVCWDRVKVLGSNSQFISNVYIYDKNGQVIQSQCINQTQGLDIMTMQYDFSGRLLRSHSRQQMLGAQTQDHEIGTKYTFDDLGRIIKMEKNINNAGWKTISQLEYDALGQLKLKKLGIKPGRTDPLEQSYYDYNIYGQVLGMNRNFTRSDVGIASESPSFGYDLGYNKSAITDIDRPSTWPVEMMVQEIGSYSNPQFDGSIAGMIWRGAGDGSQRRYDFTYDAAKRLTAADFKQRMPGSFDKSAGVDYSISNLAYDANGNITAMDRKGLKLGTSPLIDQLTYTYEANSNKLKLITDAHNDNTSMLGDLKYDAVTKTGTDYDYDVNGNLISDQNKKISVITYNYLNLPQTITVSGKGLINYVYDAGGAKLKKIVTDNTTPGKTITLTHTYVGNSVFESRQTVPADANMPDYADALFSIAHEEGRIRYIPGVGQNPGSFVYDYFVLDHLGNVRTILTEQEELDQFLAANFEDASVSTNQRDYENSAIQKVTRPSNFFSSSSNGDKVQLLKKNTQSIGVGKLLKVMVKDKVHVKVDYYIANETTDNVNADGLSALLSNLITLLNSGNAPGALKGNGVSLTSDLNSTSMFTNFLQPQNNNVPDLMPKAYLNILFFDEQFKFVEQNSELIQVSVKGSGQPIVRVGSGARMAPKNGYAYIYVSNESNNLVYFDNFQVTHERGPILEENHYYPYGLKMAAISSKTVNSMLSGTAPSYGYQGTFAEEVNDLGVNYNEFMMRNYDPQIGRWTTADPYDQFASQYIGMGNDPVNHVDPDGGWSEGAMGGLVGAAVGFAAPYLYEMVTNNEIKNKGAWGAVGALMGSGIGYGVGESSFNADSDNGSAGFLGHTRSFYKSLFTNNTSGVNGWASFQKGAGQWALGPDIWGSLRFPSKAISLPAALSENVRDLSSALVNSAPVRVNRGTIRIPSSPSTHSLNVHVQRKLSEYVNITQASNSDFSFAVWSGSLGVQEMAQTDAMIQRIRRQGVLSTSLDVTLETHLPLSTLQSLVVTGGEEMINSRGLRVTGATITGRTRAIKNSNSSWSNLNLQATNLANYIGRALNIPASAINVNVRPGRPASKIVLRARGRTAN